MVSLLMNKNPWLVPIMFAVSLTGSSYLNIEPSTPKNKIKAILNDLRVPLILTFSSYERNDLSSDKTPHFHQHLQEDVQIGNILDLSGFCMDLQNQLLSPSPSTQEDRSGLINGVQQRKRLATPLEIFHRYESRMAGMEERWPIGNGGSRTVYIVYTSGTTGDPKPIAISNANLVGFLFNYATRFQRTNDGSTRVLQFASYAFDVSVMSIWDTLAVQSPRPFAL